MPAGMTGSSLRGPTFSSSCRLAPLPRPPRSLRRPPRSSRRGPPRSSRSSEPPRSSRRDPGPTTGTDRRHARRRIAPRSPRAGAEPRSPWSPSRRSPGTRPLVTHHDRRDDRRHPNHHGHHAARSPSSRRTTLNPPGHHDPAPNAHPPGRRVHRGHHVGTRRRTPTVITPVATAGPTAVTTSVSTARTPTVVTPRGPAVTTAIAATGNRRGHHARAPTGPALVTATFITTRRRYHRRPDNRHGHHDCGRPGTPPRSRVATTVATVVTTRGGPPRSSRSAATDRRGRRAWGRSGRSSGPDHGMSVRAVAAGTFFRPAPCSDAASRSSERGPDS